MEETEYICTLRKHTDLLQIPGKLYHGKDLAIYTDTRGGGGGGALVAMTFLHFFSLQ